MGAGRILHDRLVNVLIWAMPPALAKKVVAGDAEGAPGVDHEAAAISNKKAAARSWNRTVPFVDLAHACAPFEGPKDRDQIGLNLVGDLVTVGFMVTGTWAPIYAAKQGANAVWALVDDVQAAAHLVLANKEK